VRRNVIVVVMCLELMLNAVNIALVAIANFRGGALGAGTLFALFIITLAAAEVTVTNVPAVAGVKHTFRIMCGVASVEFYIDDVRVATHTSVLPTATTLLGYTVRVTTLAAAIKNLKWGRLVLRHV
jgi:NADH:ubiquinone oxidoreductase subunit K